MVRADARRGLLFELDPDIQPLRQRVGDCPEVLGLTGHCHNLLRQWSDA